MEWTSIPIEETSEVTSAESEVQKADPLIGLTAAPNELHSAFLSKMEHLRDAMQQHSQLFQSASKPAEEHFSSVAGVVNMDSLIETLGGREENDTRIIPLHGCDLAGIDLQLGQMAGKTYLHLAADAGQGAGFNRLIGLEPGQMLKRAQFCSGELLLHFNESDSI